MSKYLLVTSSPEQWKPKPLCCSRVLISVLFGFLDIVSCWPKPRSLLLKLPWSHREWNLHRTVVTLSWHLCFVYKYLLVLSRQETSQPHMVKCLGTVDIMLKVINSISLLKVLGVNQSALFLFLYHSNKPIAFPFYPPPLLPHTSMIEPGRSISFGRVWDWTIHLSLISYIFLRHSSPLLCKLIMNIRWDSHYQSHLQYIASWITGLRSCLPGTNTTKDLAVGGLKDSNEGAQWRRFDSDYEPVRPALSEDNGNDFKLQNKKRVETKLE